MRIGFSTLQNYTRREITSSSLNSELNEHVTRFMMTCRMVLIIQYHSDIKFDLFKQPVWFLFRFLGLLGQIYFHPVELSDQGGGRADRMRAGVKMASKIVSRWHLASTPPLNRTSRWDGFELNNVYNL